MSPPIVDEYRHQNSISSSITSTPSTPTTPTTPTTNRKVVRLSKGSSSSSSFPSVEGYGKTSSSRSSSPPSPTLSSSSTTSIVSSNTTTAEAPTLCNIVHLEDSRSHISSLASTNRKLLPRLPRQQQVCENENRSAFKVQQQQQDESITSSTSASASTSYSSGSIIQQVVFGCIASIIVIKFSLTFPFIVSPYEMAKDAYIIAYWQYDPTISHFDNTIWTYGTDYLLAIIMFVTLLTIRTTNTSTKSVSVVTKSNNSSSLSTIVSTVNGNNKQQLHNLSIAVWLSRGLLATYMFSVIAGGISHQYFLTTSSQNTISFRILWTICVGFVSIASIMMGCSTSYYLYIYNNTISTTGTTNAAGAVSNSSIYIISEYFWIPFSLVITIVVAFGYFSFQCQASDIFIAGITQFPSTFYIVYVLLFGLSNTNSTTSTPSTNTFYLSNTIRIIGSIGFLLNAPLLPMYPILVKYFTLPVVNTFLHTWLCIAWSLQGYCMKHIIYSLEQSISNINNNNNNNNNHSMSMQQKQQQKQQQQQNQSLINHPKIE